MFYSNSNIRLFLFFQRLFAKQVPLKVFNVGFSMEGLDVANLQSFQRFVFVVVMVILILLKLIF